MPLLTANFLKDRGDPHARGRKRSPAHPWVVLSMALGLALHISGKCLHAAPVPGNELKAVLLFHLTQFVSWPSLPQDVPFRIGVLGPNPFGGALTEAVHHEFVNGQAIEIKHGATSKHLKDCQVIYVSSEAREPLDRIFADLKGLSILTVGESADFLDQGGMIQIARTKENKLRLQIELTRVRSAGLRVSAQLLRVSDVVTKSPP